MAPEPSRGVLQLRWTLYLSVALMVTALIWPDAPTAEQANEGDGEGIETIAQSVAIAAGVLVAGLVALVMELTIRLRCRSSVADRSAE